MLALSPAMEEAELLSEEERVDMVAVLKSAEWIAAGQHTESEPRGFEEPLEI